MTLRDLLHLVVGQLEASGARYMITGSVASSYHGEPRATRDLDIVVDADGTPLVALVDSLRGAGFYVDLDAALAALAARGQFNAIDPSTGWKVDFIVRKDRPYSRTELDRRQPADLLGTETYVVSPEDAIISKLEWAAASNSDRQLTDAAALLQVGRDSLDFEYLDRWTQSLGLQKAWARLRAGA